MAPNRPANDHSRSRRAEPFISARIEKARTALQAAKTEALLLTAFADVSWLTGFEGDDSHVLLTEDRLLLISDTRYEEQIAREAPWATAVIRKKSILEEVARQIARLKIRRLGVQSESLTLKAQADLQNFFKQARAKVKTVPLADLVVKLRHIKDEHEIAIIEEAIRIAEGAFEALRSALSRKGGGGVCRPRND